MILEALDIEEYGHNYFVEVDMRSHHLSKFFWLVLTSLLIFTTACSSLLPPNLPVTGAVQTVIPTLSIPTTTLNPVPPLATPVATAIQAATATQSSPTVAPTATAAAAAGCAVQATFIADVTIPDNSVLSPGASFVKTWRVRNDSNCAWGPGGQAVNGLTFSGGSRLGGPISISIPQDTASGSTVDISVTLDAPTQPGTYESDWLLTTSNGTLVGVGANHAHPLTAKIVVPSAPITSGTCSYQATYISDVSIPDQTVLSPDENFVKIWRVRNDGTCTWGKDYQIDRLIFTGGDSLNAPAYVNLPSSATVTPGTTVDIPVVMHTPANPGNYEGQWKLGSSSGPWLGVGLDGQTPLTVKIIVKQTTVPLPPNRARIVFGPGDTQTHFNTALTASEPQGYILKVQAGQKMIITASGGVSIGLLDPNDQEIMLTTIQPRTWTANLNTSGDYTVVLYGNGPTSLVIEVPPL